MISVLLLSALIFAGTANENMLLLTKLRVNDMNALGKSPRAFHGKVDENYIKHIASLHKITMTRSNIQTFIQTSYQESAINRASYELASKKVADLIKVLSQNPENKRNGVLETAKLQNQESKRKFYEDTLKLKANLKEQKTTKVLDDAKSNMEPSKKAMMSPDSKPKNAGLFDKVKELLKVDSKPRKAGLFDESKSKDLLPVDKKPGFMDNLVNTFKPKASSSPPTNKSSKAIEPRP